MAHVSMRSGDAALALRVQGHYGGFRRDGLPSNRGLGGLHGCADLCLRRRILRGGGEGIGGGLRTLRRCELRRELQHFRAHLVEERLGLRLLRRRARREDLDPRLRVRGLRPSCGAGFLLCFQGLAMALVPSVRIPIRMEGGNFAVVTRGVGCAAGLAASGVPQHAEVIHSDRAGGSEATLHHEVLPCLRVHCDDLSGASVALVEVPVQGLARVDLQRALEVELVVEVADVYRRAARHFERCQAHLQDVREEHDIGVDLHRPIVVQVLASIADLPEMLGEGLRVHQRRPGGLIDLRAAQQPLPVALVDRRLLILDVVGELPFGRFPEHHHETEERSALERDALGGGRDLRSWRRAPNDGADVPLRRLLARGRRAVLVAGEGLAVREVPGALRVVAALGLTAVLARPRAISRIRYPRLLLVDLLEQLLQVALVRLFGAKRRRNAVVPLGNIGGGGRKKLALFLGRGENHLLATHTLPAPPPAILQRAQVLVHRERCEVPRAAGLPQTRPGGVEALAHRGDDRRGLRLEGHRARRLGLDSRLLLPRGGHQLVTCCHEVLVGALQRVLRYPLLMDRLPGEIGGILH
mmetsp:Transcript_77757/g.225652  ORF Transcript_77757/g.225652 Transcript_77757/m.225652 type:complete len:583 (+) Transcript_77757:1380-3128(+)